MPGPMLGRSVALVVALVFWSGASASEVVEIREPSLPVGVPDVVEVHVPDADPSPVAAPQGSDPEAPRDLVVYSTAQGPRLEWDPPEAAQPDRYNVYRSVDGDEPVRVAEVTQTTYTDGEVPRDGVHRVVYHVTAVYVPEGEEPRESGPSNHVSYVALPVQVCMVAYVSPAVDKMPPAEVVPNPYFLECLTSTLPGA